MINVRHAGWLNINFVACLGIALVFSSGCSAKKTIANNTVSNRAVKENNESVQKERSKAIASFVPFTAQSYIERFKAIAIKEMNANGIPASITLAQGLFESGN